MEGASNWLIEVAQSREVVAVGLTFLLAGILQIFRRGRLVWSISHHHTFVVPPTQGSQPSVEGEASQQHGAEVSAAPSVLVLHTRDVWVQNIGRSSMSDVEVVLNYRPPHYEIWPERDFQETINPDERLVIKVPSLSSREFFTVAMISREELPNVANVRSSEGMGRLVNMGPQQIFSRPVIEGLRILLFLGLLAAIYLLVLLVQWIGSPA